MKKCKLWGTLLLSTALLIHTMTSCSDSSYLDINYNPNYPATASCKNLVPAAEASTVAVMGLYATLTGHMWCQYTTQGNSTNQYNDLCAYASSTATSYPPVTSMWQNSYAHALEDIKLALADAEANGIWNYWLVAKVLQAYHYMMLTDSYGDIPFTEALNSEYPNPKFDSSKDVVYPGILEMLNEAIAKESDAINSEKQAAMGVNDCFFGGDMSKWVAFAKSLKLKAFLKSYSTYSSEIASLLSAGGLLEEDCAWRTWEDATNKSNPLYEMNIRQLNTTENIRACHTFLEYMLAKNDPRIVYIYEPVASATSRYSTEAEWIEHLDECYEGLICGPNSGKISSTDAPLSTTSRFRQRYNDPVYLMNAAECELMIAEAYARAGNAAKAEEYYNKAVLAGFERWGLDGTSHVEDAYKFDANNMLQCIGMQYWVSYAGANAYDGWITRNRLGIPAVQADITVRADETPFVRTLSEGYVLGTLVDPLGTAMNAGEYPLRLLYPTATTLYNTSAAEYVEQNGNSMTKPLWWE